MDKGFFDLKRREWPGALDDLSKHDIVYLSPPDDPLSGIPIGNGDMGMLLWTEGGRLVAAVNKVDLFDDCVEPANVSDGAEYDREPALKHGARLIVDFGMPVFDILYLNDFNGRLGLADAAAFIEAKTPFANIKITAWASNPDKVIVLDCSADYEEEVRLDAVFERFGSRPYSYWYSAAGREPEIGLDGTQTTVEGNTVLIRQELRTLHFVAGARIVGSGAPAERRNRFSGRLPSNKACRIRFQIYISVVTSENDPAPKERVVEILNAAVEKGAQSLRSRHVFDWKRFWEKSFVRLPDEYLENIWYLNLYYANSSSRGEYPARFTNGIWGWNRDVSNWVYYFHWNMQNFIWPLHAANHAELARPYFLFRTRSLSNAIEYSTKYQKGKGAFYADVSDRLGHNVGSHWNNHTPGAQIALLYWKHYLYTLDGVFLKEEAWPVIRETSRYYADFLEKGEGGKYRSNGSQAYEGSPLFEETITDTANIAALLSAALECSEAVGHDPAETETWREMFNNLVPFHTQQAEEDEYEIDEKGQKILKFGLGKGQPLLDGGVFTVGKYKMLEGEGSENFNRDALPDYITKPLEGVIKGDRIRNRHGNPQRSSYYGIPDPELSPVYPAELIGIKDRGSPLYNASVNQVRIHPSSKPPETPGQGDMAGGGALCMGWCPYPIVLARLGLAEEAAREAANSISAWQFYPQGFGHYGPYEVFLKDRDMRWHTNTVRIRHSDECVESPSWPFRHFTFEAVPIVCAAINEMLLQSHEGIIRIFPADPKGWLKEFKLAARGSFTIHARGNGEKTEWVAVESAAGGPCRIVDPFGNGKAYISVRDPKGEETGGFEVCAYRQGNDLVFAFETEAGCMYLISEKPPDNGMYRCSEGAGYCNINIKKLGKGVLGIPRMF